jgi:hypothetical protein
MLDKLDESVSKRYELITIPYWEFPNIDNILTERLFGLEKAP